MQLLAKLRDSTSASCRNRRACSRNSRARIGSGSTSWTSARVIRQHLGEVADKLDRGTAENSPHEAIALTEQFSELFPRVHDGVDSATGPTFNSPNPVAELPVIDFADDQDIDVARRTHPRSASVRTVEDRRIDAGQAAQDRR